MGESLTERRRVKDEVLRDVNFISLSEKNPWLISRGVDQQTKGTANSVPAAAVRRRSRALFGIIGLKARVGGAVSTL
jgi:hypothetical protein